MAQTIGEQLQQARKARGLTIEQASQATHIRQHYLEALEQDQREALPSNVQGRGFLRLYAGMLGLDTNLLLALWDGKIITETEPPAQGDSPSGESPDEDQVSAEAEVDSAPLVASASPGPTGQTVEEDSNSEPGSRLIFQQIGKKLREQREALGLSLGEVERYTRLRVYYIQALEDGRLDDLPSPVQGRGMLSNYAAFLNLDEEQVLLRFAEGLQARRIERLPKPEPQSIFSKKKRPARQAPLWRRFLTPDLIFGVGLAGIILFFALWTVSRINALRAVETQPTPPGIVDVLLTPSTRGSETPVPFGSTTPSPAAVAVSPTDTASFVDATLATSTGEEVAFGQETPGVELNPVTTTDLPPNVNPTFELATATLPPMNNDPLQVYIVARQRAWLRVVADNKVKFIGRVVPGNAYAFSGANRIELSTGNAAGLQVFYNQNDLGVLGISGEVINLVFSSEGIATPTLAFSATPTALPPATLTPMPSPTAPATPTITPFIPD